MPRVSEAEKRKSHERILEAAARRLREQGVEATSIADVMEAARLTHGGFYRHFDSKGALVAAAFRKAVDEVLSEVDGAGTRAEREAAIGRYIARYLSPEHVDDRGHGCPLAALGGEIARFDDNARGEASAAVERMGALLGPESGGTEDQGFARMALLLGTITLARLAETRELARAILEAGKKGAGLLDQSWGDES